MLNWIEKNKWLSAIIFIILVSVFPILVNALSLCEAKYKVFGFQSPWLSFWGTYLAAVASLGMIIITAVSIHRNSEDNKKNREIQSNVIKYQTRLQWINQLKEVITSYCDSINDNVHGQFALFYNEHISQTNVNFSSLIHELSSRATYTKFKIDSCLIGSDDPKETFFSGQVYSYYIRFTDLLLDLQFFFTLDNKCTSNDLQKKVSNYKNAQLKSDYQKQHSHRIWEIINEYNYDIAQYNQFLIILMRRYNVQSFKTDCVNFIKYEQNKAENILYGTEQTK